MSRARLDLSGMPPLLTVAEVGEVLRTSAKAIYARIERGLFPGVVRDGRRVLLLRDDVVRYVEERASSSGEPRQ